MDTGTYFLYAGAGLAGVMALFCVLSGSMRVTAKTSKLVQIIGWSLASICIVTGIVLGYVQERFCCNRRYTQIFQTPMNDARDPDATRGQNLHRVLQRPRDDRYTRYQYQRFGRRNNYASQRYQYAY